MQIKHTVNLPSFDEMKTRVVNSRWTPVAVIIASTYVIVRTGNKTQMPKIEINNYADKVKY